MRVAILGLGYVGTVCGACFAAAGHQVVGVDVNSVKVDLINSGRSPIVEPDLDALLEGAVKSGALRATTDTAAAVRDAEITLVCVGTPSNADGSLNLEYVHNVCREIGAALRGSDGFHVVVLRSTMLPGTAEACSGIISRESGREPGDGFTVASNPEFLREGSAIRDFRNPAFTLVGSDDGRAVELLRGLYAFVEAPFHAVPLRVAEMLKYVSNVFHALKVVFANEIGMVSKALGADSHAVMDLFCSDTRLNISRTYLRPGYAYGGSCLPKDLRALTQAAREMGIQLPVLNHIAVSNDVHVRNGLELVLATGRRRVGMLGLSFKAGTDDLRESPLVMLAEALLERGHELRVYDPSLNLARLVGANKAFIDKQLPRLSRLLAAGLDEVLEASDCLVIGNTDPEFRHVPDRVRPDQVVVDLVRVDPRLRSGGNYRGICW